MKTTDIEPKGLDETPHYICNVCGNTEVDELIEVHKDFGEGFICMNCSDDLDLGTEV